MDSKHISNFMFATQTHIMSDELLNALDLMIDLSAGSTDEMCAWCLHLLKTVDPGIEFTVTAEQAQWLIANAQATFESIEVEEGESADSEDLDLIVETFDDYANFLRLGDGNSDGTDIFRMIGESKN